MSMHGFGDKEIIYCGLVRDILLNLDTSKDKAFPDLTIIYPVMCSVVGVCKHRYFRILTSKQSCYFSCSRFFI